MELNEIKAVYFIGAGGIGMSAIAQKDLLLHVTIKLQPT